MLLWLILFEFQMIYFDKVSRIFGFVVRTRFWQWLFPWHLKSVTKEVATETRKLPTVSHKKYWPSGILYDSIAENERCKPTSKEEEEREKQEVISFLQRSREGSTQTILRLTMPTHMKRDDSPKKLEDIRENDETNNHKSHESTNTKIKSTSFMGNDEQENA